MNYSYENFLNYLDFNSPEDIGTVHKTLMDCSNQRLDTFRQLAYLLMSAEKEAKLRQEKAKSGKLKDEQRITRLNEILRQIKDKDYTMLRGMGFEQALSIMAEYILLKEGQ